MVVTNDYDDTTKWKLDMCTLNSLNVSITFKLSIRTAANSALFNIVGFCLDYILYNHIKPCNFSPFLRFDMEKLRTTQSQRSLQC